MLADVAIVLFALGLWFALGYPIARSLGPHALLPALAAPPFGVAMHAAIVMVLYSLGLPLAGANYIAVVLALPGLALAIYDGVRHHWRWMDVTVLAGIVAVVVLVLLPKWVSSPAFATFQGNIGDHFYYLGVAFMAMHHDISALEIAKVGPLVTSGPEIAAPFQLITGRPAAALMFGGIAAILRQPVLLAPYAYLGALQVCVFFAAAFITRNLFKLPSLLTLWVAIGLAVGFFVQYTFDINAWSQLASISLTITTVGLFAFALVGARSSSNAVKTCAFGVGGFFLSMLVCILGILVIYPETLPMVLAIVSSIVLWRLCFFAERRLVFRQIAIFGAAAGVAGLLCIPAWSLTVGTLGSQAQWVMGDSYISDAGNWWRFYQGYLFGYDNDPSTVFDFHAARSWVGVLYRIFLVVTSFMAGILGIFFLQPDSVIPLPTLLAIVLTTGIIFLLIFGVRSVSAVSRKIVERFDLNLLAGALAALLLTIGLLSFGTQLANDSGAVPIGIVARITWKLVLLICMIGLCGLWVRSALESSDRSGEQRADRALLAGIVGGFCLLAGLLSVGRYWAAGKGLIMLSPILFVALVGSLLASKRLRDVLKVAVLVYVGTQVSFGVYRSYAASRAGSGAFYSAPYPLDQYQKWRFRWDYAGLKDQLKSCSKVDVHSSGLYYELFVKMILTDLRIPWSTQDDGSIPRRADEPNCLLTTEVDDMGAKGEIIWAQRDDRLIKFYRGEASGLDLIPIPEGLETKGIAVEESRMVGVAWTDGHAVLRVPVGPKTPVKRLTLAVGPERPSVDMHSVDMHIAVFVNGQRILEDDVPPNIDSSNWTKTVAVPHLRGESSLTIAIDSDEFLLPDGHSVGARLYKLSLER